MLGGSGRLVGVELALDNGRKVEICHALPETLVSLIEERKVKQVRKKTPTA